MKPRLKADTWNRLRNTPLFSPALFPDDILATAEQDMKMHQVLKVPVRAHSSTLAESNNIIITNLMTRRTVGKLVTPLVKLPSLRGNFRTRVEDAVAGVEVATHLISPRHPALNNSINDNYWEIDPPLTNFLEGQKTSQIDQTVNLNVVFPAPYVIRQSQKEDISPSPVQNE